MNFNVIPILVSNEKVIAKQFRLVDTLSTDVLFVAQRDSRHNLRCWADRISFKRRTLWATCILAGIHYRGDQMNRLCQLECAFER